MLIFRQVLVWLYFPFAKRYKGFSSWNAREYK